jgi:hypothetical protein
MAAAIFAPGGFARYLWVFRVNGWTVAVFCLSEKQNLLIRQVYTLSPHPLLPSRQLSNYPGRLKAGACESELMSTSEIKFKTDVAGASLSPDLSKLQQRPRPGKARNGLQPNAESQHSRGETLREERVTRPVRATRKDRNSRSSLSGSPLLLRGMILFDFKKNLLR